MKGLEVEGRAIVLANVAGTFYAIQRKCPHMGYDLSNGMLEGAKLICRMHGATYHLATGEPLAKAKLLFFKPQPRPATTYPVKVEGGRVFVAV